MKINNLAIFGLLSLVPGSVARRGNRFRAHDENDSLTQKSRVTAFVNTDDGLRVECWEIGDLLPQNHVTRADGSKGTVRRMSMGEGVVVQLFSFGPDVTLFEFGATGVHSNAIDFRSKPNLFTVKDGIIIIEASGLSGNDVATQEDDDTSTHVFADINGDDWFYFEDTSSSSREQCVKATSDSSFTARTISGSESTLINFQYDGTPPHKVLHEGRCNFAGLVSASTNSQSDPDSGRFRFRSQEL